MISDFLSRQQQQALESLISALAGDASGRGASRVMSILDEFLLDDEQLQTMGLQPWNLYFLCAAACLFGGRASRTGEEISGTAGIKDENQAKVLLLIGAGMERDPDSEDTALDVVEYEDQIINVPLISRAVCLAAALDIEHPDRVGAIAAGMAGEDRLPDKEVSGSFRVTAMGPHPFASGAIRLRIQCTHAGVHRALKQYETRVQTYLHQANSRVSPRFLFSEVVFEIEPCGYVPLDMKFAVDSMAALRLLTGNRLYSDKRVFLRELVQNAVDACNLNRLFQPAYEPEISIEFDPGYRTVRFRDNGIGMDRQWIEKYFLKVGISFYQSGDLKSVHRSRMDCHFISKFGIGFLSSFLAADRILIRTRKKGSPGLIIAINTLQDYFDVRFAPEDCPGGTEVTLFLSPDNRCFSRSMDYVCYLKNNLRFLSVPVKLTDHQGRTVILGREKLPYSRDNRTGRDFVTPLNFDHSEGYLFLKAKENLGRIYALDYAKGGVSIFQDGIFVAQIDSLLPEGARQNIIGRINLIGEDRCELSMDRNRIFWTDRRLLTVKEIIRTGIVDLANRVLDHAAGTESPADVNPGLVNHLAVFFDFNEINDEMYVRLNPILQNVVAKRFRDFIRIHFSHTRENRHVPDADGYGERWQQEIIGRFADRSRPPVRIKS